MVRINQSERGQGLTEYALILVLVSLVVIIVLQIFGPQVGNVFSQIISLLAPLT
jgi:pilus assembly protein Flp/PilA